MNALRESLALLARGHDLYAGPRVEPPMTGWPTGVAPADRLRFAAPGALRLAAARRRAAGADVGLTAVLADARDEHDRARWATRAVLDDAYADVRGAVDTPVGRREALRRSVFRLREQRRQIQGSRQRSRLLAAQLRRLGYPHRHHHRRAGGATIPLDAVRYQRPGHSGRISAHLSAALDHLGIVDPAARRNWLRGYTTLIARESGGRAAAVAGEPATDPGPPQTGGHRLGYARGLTQTIPATFARYHQPGTSTNIYDPVANICASMNYVMHRYGVAADGENLAALVQQADPRRPPKGY
ncbi:transglycosylase SLT domain-containing protein [Mycobacterium sp.]|uniref:transglycosylase SLT domain-containing protein n=1 Tax=Mycobacterium sp. TaxID=1785 RepID=UPI0031E1981A